MQRLSSLKVAWQQKATFFIVALLVVSFDQLSKLWIELNLAVGESLPETGFFRLTHIRNTGASFGLFQDQSLVLAIVSIIGIGVLLPDSLHVPPIIFSKHCVRENIAGAYTRWHGGQPG